MPIPPSISTDRVFQQGQFYSEYIRPAGFRDGMAALLTHGHAVSGVLYVSSEKERYGDRERESLATCARTLGAAVRMFSPHERCAHGAPHSSLSEPGVEWFSVGEVRNGAFTAGPDADRLFGASSDREFTWGLQTIADSVTRPLRYLWVASHRTWRIELSPGLRHDGFAVHAASIDAPHHLTERELEVFAAIAFGFDTGEIADLLVISRRTVHAHVERILHKLGARSRVEAASLAWRGELVWPREKFGGVAAMTRGTDARQA